MGKLQDLTGKVFGRLTVIKRGEDRIYESEKGKQIVPRWWCICACGNPNPVLINGQALRKGQTQSCGCIQREKIRLYKKQFNRYELHGDIVVGYTNKGQAFYFDSEDYELVYPHCWYMHDLGYLETRMPNGKLERMHRLIMHASETELIDHINHSTNDNRKCNLRKVTKSENTRNSGLSKNNTSGVTGVHWDNSRGKWSAAIFHNWCHHSLGRFDSFDEAVAARKAAEEKYFGEYSYSNSISAVPRVQLN